MTENREIAIEDLPSDMPSVPPTPAMVESVRKLGVIEPIIIKMHRGEIKIIGGRRRIQAAKIANLKTIPARIFSEEWKEDEIISLLLNEQRSSNPVAELISIEHLLEDFTIDQIQNGTGIPKKKIQKLLKLRKLMPELRKAFDKGQIKPSIALQISSLGKTDQRKLLTELRISGKIKQKDVAKIKSAKKEEAISKLPLDIFQMPAWKKVSKEQLENLKKIIEKDAPVQFLQIINQAIEIVKK